MGSGFVVRKGASSVTMYSFRLLIKFFVLTIEEVFEFAEMSTFSFVQGEKLIEICSSEFVSVYPLLSQHKIK